MSLISRRRPDASRDTRPEVRALSSAEWRVRDVTLPESDGRSVLGVVQQIGDTFEVTQIGSPLARYYFASLDDAVDYLSGR